MDEFVGKEIARIRALVGEKGQVIGKSPRYSQGLPHANISQALCLGESTLRFVFNKGLESRGLTETGCSQAHE